MDYYQGSGVYIRNTWKTETSLQVYYNTCPPSLPERKTQTRYKTGCMGTELCTLDTCNQRTKGSKLCTIRHHDHNLESFEWPLLWVSIRWCGFQGIKWLWSQTGNWGVDRQFRTDRFVDRQTTGLPPTFARGATLDCLRPLRWVRPLLHRLIKLNHWKCSPWPPWPAGCLTLI